MNTRRVQDLFDLKGQVALVTGGSRGLGLQLAESLGEAGARIMLSARKAAELCGSFELSPPAEKLLEDAPTPVDFLERLTAFLAARRAEAGPYALAINCDEFSELNVVVVTAVAPGAIKPSFHVVFVGDGDEVRTIALIPNLIVSYSTAKKL